MYIHEAIQKAYAYRKCLKRKEWDVMDVKIKPDIFLGMPLDIMRLDGSDRRHYWNPSSEDLMSDDWYLVE